ncbi:MAG: hypothetical protein U0787_08755 [Polyangia bacterium]
MRSFSTQKADALRRRRKAQRCRSGAWVCPAISGKRPCTASQDQTVRICELPADGHRQCCKVSSRAVTDCRFLPDGEHVLSSSEDKTLRLWDLATGKTQGEPLRGHVDRITGIAVSRDGLRAVSASEDQTLRLWDLTTLQSIGPGLRGHVRSICSWT